MGHFLQEIPSQFVVEGSKGCSNELFLDQTRPFILLDTVFNHIQAHRQCGCSSDKPVSLIIRVMEYSPYRRNISRPVSMTYRSSIRAQQLAKRYFAFNLLVSWFYSAAHFCTVVVVLGVAATAAAPSDAAACDDDGIASIVPARGRNASFLLPTAVPRTRKPSWTYTTAANQPFRPSIHNKEGIVLLMDTCTC